MVEGMERGKCCIALKLCIEYVVKIVDMWKIDLWGITDIKSIVGRFLLGIG